MYGFGRMLSYEQYPEEKSRLWLSSFKKIDQPSWRTTRRNYKHIPQIVCISSADIYEKFPFLVFFGATDGNFIEKYSVTPS